MNDLMQQPLAALERVFGYSEFRPFQREVIGQVMGGGDVLALAPTGGGKSLCYQVPAVCRPGVCVVISPLIALMKDQVDALRQHRVSVGRLDSSLSAAEKRHTVGSLYAGELDLLYVAPERALMDDFSDMIAQVDLALFAVDEAHCVSQWGHDFRPDYRRLPELLRRFAEVPRLALTATADDLVRRDVISLLELRDPLVSVTSFDRPNIRYTVRSGDRALDQLAAFIQREHANEAGIVYCLSRNGAENAAAELNARGLSAVPYHAGMEREQRRQSQDRFLREDGLIVAATIAFGMGIDKPDVRFVAHLNLPRNIESYYQETGRAGRDGKNASAILLYQYQDVVQQAQFIDSATTENEHGEPMPVPHEIKQLQRDKLNTLLGFCESAGCRRRILLRYFGEQREATYRCGNCDNCLEAPSTVDATVAVQKLLSAVVRTGNMFGAGYLIDVLLGKSGDERIERNRHHQLPTFGVGGEFSRTQWRSVVRQVVALGLLKPDPGGKGGLKITPDGRSFLAESAPEPIILRTPDERKTTRSRSAPAAPRPAAPQLQGDDRQLFDELRRERSKLASEQAVPAYVIFHDATLREMAQQRPGSKEQMLTLSGVGEAKLARYGEQFLAVIQRFDD